MKKPILLVIALCITVMLQAVVSKTINISTAGSLSTALTTTEKNTVTNLTVTGVIDQRDFLIMRSSMFALAVIDLSGVSIADYSTNPANEIPVQAFSDCSILTSIILPTSTTVINSNAFYNCTNLSLITIPSSIITINNNAFSNCTNLATVNFNATNCTYIANSVFSGCTGLNTVNIGDNVRIPIEAFKNCSSLTTVNLSPTVISIGSYAFRYCTGLTFISIPESVTNIGISSFEGCTNLSSIEFNAINCSCENAAAPFNGCTALNTVTVGDKVNRIPAFLLYLAKSLTTINIPISVESIGGYAFSGCSSLDSIYIPSSVKTISNYAFSNCTALKKIDIPSSVTSIGIGAFSGCKNATSLSISSSISLIPDAVFANCTGLTSVTIPSSVTKIGNGIVKGCTGLQSVIIPTSVDTIGMEVFCNCTSLDSINISSSVNYIGNFAFQLCSAYIIVDGNNPNYSSIDGILFDKLQTRLIQCPTSKSGIYTIPSSVNTVGNSAFYHCTNLTTVVIPSSVTSIEAYGFNGSGLTTLTIPLSITSIGSYNFANCTGLQSIYVNANQPINLSSSSLCFYNVNKTSCILHVPIGSKTVYQAANQWSDFLNIVEDLPAVVNNATASQIKLSVQNGQAKITGVPTGETICIYNLQGTAIYSQQADAETVTVDLPAHGVYVVRVGGESIKVIY